MDATRQQNAALVEQAASASKLMQDCAQQLVRRVEFFRTLRTQVRKRNDDDVEDRGRPSIAAAV
jgi:hypothetical protein